MLCNTWRRKIYQWCIRPCIHDRKNLTYRAIASLRVDDRRGTLIPPLARGKVQRRAGSREKSRIRGKMALESLQDREWLDRQGIPRARRKRRAEGIISRSAKGSIASIARCGSALLRHATRAGKFVWRCPGKHLRAANDRS